MCRAHRRVDTSRHSQISTTSMGQIDGGRNISVGLLSWLEIILDSIQFNSIQNSLFSTQHIVHTTMFLAYDVLKRERAEDSAYVGSFPNIII